MRTSSPLYPSQSKSRVSHRGITFSLGYPVLFHWLAFGVVLGLLLISAVKYIIPLLAISVFFLILAIVSWLWSWRAQHGVSYELNLSQSRAFPGEKIDLNFTVANRKWLPLPWLEIETELPYRLATGSLKTRSPYAKERLRWTTSISGGQEVSWKHQLECQARGDYRLGPVRLRSGDIFGVFPRETLLPRFTQLLVYPRIVSVDKLGLPLRELFGETEMPRTIYEDASRIMGTRDYQGGDPFKRIHWKATAHHRQLQSRQYESTTSLSLMLILDVYSFYQHENNEEPFEQAVTTVASLAYYAHREDYPVGLIANSIPEIQIPIHSGRSQLLLLLEALARIEAKSYLPLHEMLKTRGSLPAGATLVIITNVPSPALTGLVRKLKQEGHYLQLLSMDKPIQGNNLSGILLSVQSPAILSRSYREAKS